MFERRLRYLLIILLAVAVLLLLRAAQLQVLGVDQWRAQAAASMKQPLQLETTRGKIVDRNGVPLAIDEPCTDACVDFRALTDTPNPDWLKAQALARLLRNSDTYRGLPSDKREAMRKEEADRVVVEINHMWRVLAQEGGQTLEQIADTRHAIINRVQMRRRVIWFARYNRALERFNDRPDLPWYKEWLITGDGDTPELDHFEQSVAEEEDAYPILSNISIDTLFRLQKAQEELPGLIIRPGVRRIYPLKDVACHVIGHMGRVAREDIQNDRWLGVDPLRQYQYNDDIGRTGIESYCEPTLRGSRGQVIRIKGEAAELERSEPEVGKNVRLSIDSRLQADVERAFEKVLTKNHDKTIEEHEMHGAAVVIDVATSEVLALASNPRFDLNRFDEDYPTLVRDDLNQTLLNRATQQSLVPGSTVKPIVGLGAITDGIISTDSTIECTGYLVIDGRKIREGFRCWTASGYEGTSLAAFIPHHQMPIPHPTGFLDFSDGLERSCNVFFETTANRMGIGELSKWYNNFGLGRKTEIGIPETRGRIPSPDGLPHAAVLRATWFGGIGQGQVAATPIQMANVAATIARGGIWRRPTLLHDHDVQTTTRPTSPDTVDLHIPPAAIAAAKKGMTDVVNSSSGTGTDARRGDILVAGKTGTATASRLSVPQRDGERDYIRDDHGRVERTIYEPMSKYDVGSNQTWYRGFGEDGKTVNHAWFIGFVPADHPKLAFAAMVEWGGSGGKAAASVVKQVIDACEQRGYLGEEYQHKGDAGRDVALLQVSE